MTFSFLWAQILIPQQPPVQAQDLPTSQASATCSQLKSQPSRGENWTAAQEPWSPSLHLSPQSSLW